MSISQSIGGRTFNAPWWWISWFDILASVAQTLINQINRADLILSRSLKILHLKHGRLCDLKPLQQWWFALRLVLSQGTSQRSSDMFVATAPQCFNVDVVRPFICLPCGLDSGASLWEAQQLVSKTSVNPCVSVKGQVTTFLLGRVTKWNARRNRSPLFFFSFFSPHFYLDKLIIG